MTRIVGGSLGGRRLAVPRSGTRPTGERVREALFGTLGTLGAVAGARVLDLYAGSGAVGLEALSRGAASVDLVESDRRACATLRANVAALGVAALATVHCLPVERFLRAGGPPEPADLVFADPPYALPDEAVGAVLAALVGGGWVAPGGVVVLERARRDGSVVWPTSLQVVRERTYGDSTLAYALLDLDERASGRPPGGQEPAEE